MSALLLLLAALGSTPCAHLLLETKPAENLLSARGSIACVSEDGTTPVLENYPHWLSQIEEKGLDDINLAWVYPKGHSPSSMDVAARSTLGSYAFHTRLGKRAGPLGVLDGTSFMLGGWHPQFSSKGIITALPIHYVVHLPAGVGGLVGSQIVQPGPSRTLRGVFKGRYLPLVLSRGFRVWRKGSIQVLSWQNKPSAEIHAAIPFGLKPLGEGDRLGAEEAILETIEMMEPLNLGRFTQDVPVTVVVGPGRKSLAQAFDGGVYVSDRAFLVMDWERVKRFHRHTLWRFLMGALLRPAIMEKERNHNVSWVTDAVAASLRTQLYEQTYGATEWASDILAKFAVIPEIDALLHAPQIPFASTYFLAVDETTNLDGELSHFRTAHAPGKLLVEKLADLNLQHSPARLSLAYLEGDKTFTEHLRHELGADRTDQLLAWRNPAYPRVDYSLGPITQREDALRVSVLAKGESEAQDTVTVEVQTQEGVYRQSRSGAGIVDVPMAGTLEQVVIDPDGRLVEHLHPHGKEARYNNYLHPRWRFLLNNISGIFAVTNQSVSLAADFSLRQIYDQRSRYRFSLHHTPASAGLSAGITYGFGPELTAMRLSHSVGARVSYAWLRAEENGSEGSQTGHLTRLSVGYSHDTRQSPYFAFSGHGWKIHSAGGYYSRESSSGFYGQAGAAVFGILRLSSFQGLLGRARVDTMMGVAPEQALLRLGGIYRGSRGYETDAVRTPGLRTLLTLEHRHALFTGAKLNFAGALMWTRLEGAFFANATYMPNHDSPCQSPVFYDVGYGLRFIGDVLNISPAAVMVDVGFPLNRCALLPGHHDFTVYLSFVQSLAGF